MSIKKLIFRELDELFTPENAQLWWQTPNSELGHQTPEDLYNAGQGDKVLDILTRFGQ